MLYGQTTWRLFSELGSSGTCNQIRTNGQVVHLVQVVTFESFKGKNKMGEHWARQHRSQRHGLSQVFWKHWWANKGLPVANKSALSRNQIPRTASANRQTVGIPAKSTKRDRMSQNSKHLTPYITIKNQTHDFNYESVKNRIRGRTPLRRGTEHKRCSS